MRIKDLQFQPIARNIAVCVAIFVAARYIVAPHTKREQAGAPTMSVQQAAAIRVAADYVKAHHAEFDLHAHPATAIDRGDRIEVHYDATGAEHIVVIDKASMSVRSGF